MNKIDVQNRFIELQQQKQQLIRNIDALDGAMQDCEYWLKKINEAESKKENDHERTSGEIPSNSSATTG